MYNFGQYLPSVEVEEIQFSNAFIFVIEFYIIVNITQYRTWKEQEIKKKKKKKKMFERRFWPGNNPAGSWCLYTITLTSMQHSDVASTLMRRCNNVMCPLGRIRRLNRIFAVRILVWLVMTKKYKPLFHVFFYHVAFCRRKRSKQ